MAYTNGTQQPSGNPATASTIKMPESIHPQHHDQDTPCLPLVMHATTEDKLRWSLELAQRARNGVEPAGMIDPKHLQLYLKIQAVMACVGSVAKDGYNQLQNYRYASEAAIKAALHTKMADVGLLFIPRETEIVSVEKQATKSGGSQTVTLLNLHYRWVDADTGAYLDCSMHGGGVDSAEKGVYKAITGAVKYALSNTFIISTMADDGSASDPEYSRRESKPVKAPVPMAEVKPEVKPDLAPLPEKPLGRKTMEERFSTMREAIGETAFYRILQDHQLNNVGQIKTREQGKKPYLAMEAEYDRLHVENAREAAVQQ